MPIFKKILLCCLVLQSIVLHSPEKRLSKEQEFVIFQYQDENRQEEFSPITLYAYMLRCGILNVDIAFRQVIQETGHFTHPIWIEHNNLFGMKFPLLRETTAVSIHNGYSGYTHWKKSVKDYWLWQQYYLAKGYDLSDYYSFLVKVGYSQDPKYVKNLKGININRYL